MAPETPSALASLTPRDLILTLRELPSPPEAYYTLTRLTDHPGWEIEEVAAVIEREPSLTARLLRLVNSPYYSLGRRVSTVAEAVRVAGSHELRNLVLVTTVLRAFGGISPDLLSIQDFWRRSLHAAVAARLLALRGPCRPQEPDLFVAGLLADIGSLIVALKLPELARQALLFRPDPTSGQAFSLERAVLGTPESAVGKELLRHWRLPVVLEMAAAFQPVPEQAGDYTAAAATVQLAVRTAAALDAKRDPLSLIPADDPVWTRSGLEPRDVTELRGQIERKFADALAVFTA